MHIRRLTATFVGIALIIAGTPFSVTATETVRLIVELDSPAASIAPSVRTKAISVDRLSFTAPKTYEVDGVDHTAQDLRRWVMVEVEASLIAEVQQLLEADNNVVSVHQEYIYQQVGIPNDPQFALQYGLNSALVPSADINAPAAWDTTTGSSSTVIAIIDGGVDTTHEDLQSKLWVNDDTAGDGIDNDGNGFIDDTHGWDFVTEAAPFEAIHHATHVAGIAAASGNNGIGIAGVDWGARIMTIRVLGFGGAGGEGNIIEGINYAVANGAKIINLSIAGSSSSALGAAIENAYANGVLIVAAAGNNGISTDFVSIYPACADVNGVNTVLGVGATNDTSEPANFSNYGRCVDVSAPGDDILSTKVGNRYGEMSGTSMSAPAVAGVAGLYVSQHPGASPAEIMNAIMSTAELFTGEDATEWNAQYKGKLNAAGVVGIGGASSGSSDDGGSSSSDGGSSTGSPFDSELRVEEGSGDGGDSGGGGGGGGGGEEPQPTPKPKVLGTTKGKPNLTLIPKINAAFRTVFVRNPNPAEHTYWFTRVKRGEKKSFAELVGAMAWQKAKGRTYIPSSK